MSLVLLRSALLVKEKLKPGLEVRLDVNQRVALEVVGMGKRVERSLETVTEMPWASIGGQDEAVQAIRDTIEMPFLHKDLFKRFQHNVPKGFLLYGPPGLRQDAARQGDRLQSAPADQGRKPAWIIRNSSCTSKARKF